MLHFLKIVIIWASVLLVGIALGFAILALLPVIIIGMLISEDFRNTCISAINILK